MFSFFQKCSLSPSASKPISYMAHDRYELLDILRGLTFISMLVYHTVWDLVYLFGVPLIWYKGPAAFWWQQSICCSFLFLSGFCWSLGHRPIFRGVQVFLAGLIITAVTVICMPESRIVFGVLTLLGSSMLLMIPLNALCKRVSPLVGLLVSLALFVFLRPINRGVVGVGGWQLSLPAVLYRDLFSTYLGFMKPGFFSTDYFSLLPWFFLFLSGYFAYGVWVGCGKHHLAKQLHLPVVAWMGRHSLILYMLHQPLIYLVLWVFLQGLQG